ncbi:uncharacterized protein LOC114538347 isoform X2 [Dendronephthya gigantea]|uniref:uncharacterized protein LOC114538347 isoform X2 n=1 Tax=Dendronephthya gigantea TaxID=151771 RepID=UPI00106936E8|nr:uncharacterized protein LOC114538347 isoform X2 [Dendronephthya gigantea]
MQCTLRSINSCQQVFCLLISAIAAIALCGALEVNNAGCVNDCKEKIKRYQEFCEVKCSQESLSSRAEKAKEDSKSASALPKPAAPKLVDAGWRKIRVRFNTTELEVQTQLEYILEVKPLWGRPERGQYFYVFPYTRNYRRTNKTTYTIEDLEPNTDYKFRVIAIKNNTTSNFSNWSNVMNTTEFCETEPPCGVTNIRLNLTTEIPYQKDVDLKYLFRWTPSTSFKKINQTKVRVNFSVMSECILNFNEESYLTVKNKELVGSNTFSSKKIYYNCWYMLEIQAVDTSIAKPLETLAGKRRWIFHIPTCIQINNKKICGCSYRRDEEPRLGLVNATFRRETTSQNNTASGRFTWSDEIWRKDSNLTYFQFILEIWDPSPVQVFDKYYNVSSIVSQYNTTIYNLTINAIYKIFMIGYTHHHCEHRYKIKLEFNVSFPCENFVCRKNNSICYPDGYTGKRKCRCMDGFLEKRDECIQPEKKPETEKDDSEKGTSNTGIIIASVLIPVAVVLIAVCLIVCLKRRHKRQMTFMEKEFEYAMDAINPNRRAIDVRSIDLDMLGTEGEGRVMNLIYVSPENVYEIPEYLSEPISRFELPPDSVKLDKMIGRGAFGRVYAGEARGINGNPEFTAVAIKTLKESAKGEGLCDFLREIDLMKDLGGHENVIKMHGCCTKTRPICLVLEYAPGGNLLNHLRALKKKCKDSVVAARTDDGPTNSKEENFTEPGEMPSDEKSVTKDGGSNAEISNRIKEEIRASLDSKELESFSHQIAAGMKYISDHGIVHRDLAARNILLGKDKILKISDFGLSREGTYVQKPGGRVPYRWLAIEAIQERSYSTASDVWAFGIVLWEICTLGDTPYSTVSDRDLKDFLLSGKRLEKVENCTDNIYEIMSKCWSHLPQDRPTFGELYDKLWELQNKGRIYVNVDSLVKQSTENERDENSEEIGKDSDSCDESGDDVDSPRNETPLITG